MLRCTLITSLLTPWLTAIMTYDISTVHFVRVCGPGVYLPLVSDLQASGRTLLQCLSICGQHETCSGFNYIHTGARAGDCDIFLYDPVDPCTIIINGQDAEYYRKPKVNNINNI